MTEKQAVQWAVNQTEPFVRLIMQVKLRERPTYMIDNGGVRLVDDGLSDEDRWRITQCEELIQEINQMAKNRVASAYPPAGLGPSGRGAA